MVIAHAGSAFLSFGVRVCRVGERTDAPPALPPLLRARPLPLMTKRRPLPYLRRLRWSSWLFPRAWPFRSHL